jgi:hypothetical protein
LFGRLAYLHICPFTWGPNSLGIGSVYFAGFYTLFSTYALWHHRVIIVFTPFVLLFKTPWESESICQCLKLEERNFENSIEGEDAPSSSSTLYARESRLQCLSRRNATHRRHSKKILLNEIIKEKIYIIFNVDFHCHRTAYVYGFSCILYIICYMESAFAYYISLCYDFKISAIGHRIWVFKLACYEGLSCLTFHLLNKFFSWHAF